MRQTKSELRKETSRNDESGSLGQRGKSFAASEQLWLT